MSKTMARRTFDIAPHGIILTMFLKGDSPAQVPVEQPTKFELALNLETARSLGLTVPPSLLLRADRAIP